MSRSKKLIHGASWLYGSQLASVVAQFVYAAIVSRLVSPDGFGTYSVALSVAALATLVAGGGFNQAVGRMKELNKSVLRSLVSYCVFIGIFVGIVQIITAGFWANLWGVPEAKIPIMWLAIATVTSPFLALSTGVLQRLGKFKPLAIITFIANIAGMVVGVFAVMIYRNASSLLVSAIIAQITIVFCGFMMSEKLITGLAKFRHGADEMIFSAKSTFSNLLSYLAGNIPRIAVGRFVGVGSLGQLNRSSTVTTLPFSQVQTALIQAVYPQFRHERDNPERAKVVWTEMLVLIGWLVIPAGAIAAAVIPNLIPVIFGPGWTEASYLAVPLSIAGAILILTSLLSSALTSLGEFKIIWWIQVIIVSLQTGVFFLVMITRSVMPLVIGIIFAALIEHAIGLSYLTRKRYLDIRIICVNYSFATIFGGVLWFYFATTIEFIFISGEMGWVGLGLIAIFPTAIFGIWASRKRNPVWQIALKYGLNRSK